MSAINLKQGLFATLLVAGLCACGGKSKKQETVPGDTSGGATTETAKPSEGTTETTSKPNANLQDVVYFPFDQADLDAEAKKKLDENAAWLKADAARSLTIEGHTDEVGTAEYNLGLGERRAKVSRDYLLALGADATKVSIITYGEEKPAGSEDSQNRRSVFIATKK
jgi:peptidoglycan-associated lipoprotein